MAEPEALYNSLVTIAAQLNDEMSERDVENLFLEQGFYDALDYEGTGTDIRSEFTLPDERRPDYLTLDGNERVTAVYEFKTSGRDLDPHTEQLFGYMQELRAEYGVLTNGDRFELYRGGESDPILGIHLEATTESEARDLASALGKPEWDITDPTSVNEYIQTLDPIPVEGDLGQDHFFDTFRLETGSPFANLVTAMMDLLRELRDEREAKFVSGAYDFWAASYASEPDDVPNSWEDFISGEQDLRDFMFCLESGHALLARLLLAKACEDRDFFPANTGIREYFRELQGFGSSIDLDAYPVAANGLMEDMRNHLVESLFEDDIFIWWTDGYQEETASLHADPYSRFRDVAQEGSRIERVSPATRERFSRAVAQVFFATLKFDLSAIEGDPLGDLYQHYFDPETRKALGEFYTPQEVVEYIMDGVEYEVGVSNERLMDPACGSGTFLVEAVERYLDDVRRYDDDPSWAEHLTDLCSRPNIVGLDIHPFAVLMAQIRFMIAILPEYREAKREHPNYTIRRLPIFRTDTLRNEREGAGIDLGDEGERQLTWDSITEDSQDVLIPVPLPVEVEEDEAEEREGDFLIQRVRMPLFDTIQLETGVSNFGEYFAALQGVLDVVKFHMQEDMWEYGGGLEEGIHRYTTREYVGIEEFFAPYVDDILSTVQFLRAEHGDGRLFKMFEDSVLALVVKNYMDYDYVVGNPPYVNRRNIPDTSDELYRELYVTPHWHYDLYVLFVERGLQMLTDDGKLSYIMSDQFMTRRYGEKLRGYLTENARIDEIIDFGDTGLFADATNYPCIIRLSRGRTVEPIPVVVVHEPVELPMQTIRDVVRNEVYDNTQYTSFFVDPDNLTEEIWSLIPQRVQSVFDRVQEDSSRLDEIAEIISGARIGKDDVFIGEKVTDGEVCEFLPQRADDPVQIESELLRPIVKGQDVRRWEEAWKGKYMIYPLDGDSVIPPDDLRDGYPHTYTHFQNHEEALRDRVWFDQGPVELHGVWYAPMYIDSFDDYQQTTILTPALTDENNFSRNETGCIFVGGTAGVLGVIPEADGIRDELLGYLNSTLIGAYLKSSAPSKASGYYQLSEDLLNTVPVGDLGREFMRIVNEITEVIDAKRMVTQFPHPYLDGLEGELEYISYEWQSQRRPVEAKIEELEDGRYDVRAGRTDRISDPRMHGDNDEHSLNRAQYVLSSVNNQNVDSGEVQSIPIPRRDADVTALLEQLEADLEQVGSTDLEALEAEIDTLVFDLFDLDEDEREIIEDYLTVF